MNRSARLEPASAQIGCDILIDKSTYELLKDSETFRFRKVPRISVKGISKELNAYEPFFADQVSTTFLHTFEQGVSALESGDTKSAVMHFSEAEKQRPGGDAASKMWLEFGKDHLKGGTSFDAKAVKK